MVKTGLRDAGYTFAEVAPKVAPKAGRRDAGAECGSAIIRVRNMDCCRKHTVRSITQDARPSSPEPVANTWDTQLSKPTPVLKPTPPGHTDPQHGYIIRFRFARRFRMSKSTVQSLILE